MKVPTWIKRTLALALAAGGIGFAWHVYREQYPDRSIPLRQAQASKAPTPRPAPKAAVAGTAPKASPSTKPALANAKPPLASTEPVEEAGTDPFHHYDPKDPFRIARANRHIDGPTETVRAVALSSDKTKLVTGGNDRMVRLFDFASGKELHHFEGHTAFVRGVDISSDGKRILSGGEDNTVRVWDVDSGEQIAEMEHQGHVTGAAFLSEPNQIISTSTDGTACFWDIEKEKVIKKIDYQRRVCAMAICLPANVLALGTHGGTVYLWDLKSRTELRKVETEPVCIQALAISRDGKRLVIQPAMEHFRVVDVATGKILFEESQDQWDRVWSIALSGDGETLALGRGFQVIFYNLKTFERHKTYLNPNADAQAMCFLPDTNKFIVAGGGFEGKDGRWMRPWIDTILIFNLPQPLP